MEEANVVHGISYKYLKQLVYDCLPALKVIFELVFLFILTFFSLGKENGKISGHMKSAQSTLVCLMGIELHLCSKEAVPKNVSQKSRNMLLTVSSTPYFSDCLTFSAQQSVKKAKNN
jgi:hypothetical protein